MPTVNDALKPFVNVIVCAAAVVPTVVLAKVRLLGDMATGAKPVPERVTICGLLAELSVNVSVPAAAPRMTGEKVTPMVQVAPAPMLAPQVLVATVNAPLVAILAKLRATFSWFVSVTDVIALVLPTATLEKFRVLAETVTGMMPVPVRLTEWGLLLELSVMMSVPVWAVTAAGVNAMSRVQLAPPGSVFGFRGQVPPVCVKGPLMATLLIVNGTACTLVSVSV